VFPKLAKVWRVVLLQELVGARGVELMSVNLPMTSEGVVNKVTVDASCRCRGYLIFASDNTGLIFGQFFKLLPAAPITEFIEWLYVGMASGPRGWQIDVLKEDHSDTTVASEMRTR
jgi:hypothetical protein